MLNGPGANTNKQLRQNESLKIYSEHYNVPVNYMNYMNIVVNIVNIVINIVSLLI